MKPIKTYFFLFFFSINLISEDIEEVIVQGNWRETRLIEEDSSVLVLSSKETQSAPIKHFENLSYLIPNLNFAASDSRARHFQIRGIGERSGYERTPNSAVGFLVDDIDYSGQGGIATTFDVDQIEVHRGPQGSRIGSSAMAGLIYIKTKEPTKEFEGVSEITTGAYGTRNVGIAFGGSAQDDNEDFTYRIALRKDYSDGFRKNLYSGRSDASKKDESTFRLKANWEINSESTIKFLMTQIDLDDPADIWTIDGSLNTLSDRPGMDSQKTDAYGIKFFHETDNFEFQSLTSVTDTNVVLSYDADWGNSATHAPYIYDYFSETQRKRETFSQEFRFLSNLADLDVNKRSEWVLGLHFFESKETNLKNDDGIYGDSLDSYGPYISESSSTSKFSVDNFSIFGNLNYLINDSTTFSLGARWEDSESTYSDSFGESFNPSDKISGGKLSINKILKQDTNIFISIARGYNQGGFNLNLGLDPNSINSNLYYDPEFLTNYELGLNSKIVNLNMNLAAVIFHSDRKDQQVLISTQVDPTDPNTFTFLTQNAAEGTNNGIELEIDFQLSDNLDIFINFGLLKTQIKNWKSRPDLQGRAQAHAPEKSYAIGFNWNLTEQSNLSFDVVGKSSFYYSDSHNNRSKSYFLTNLSYSYFSGQWTYSIWGRNIFDEYYSTRGFYFGNEAPNFIDTLYERHGDPRHMGVTVRYDF
ncbi:MAG: TonB-dependent receptor [Proteobacteria bacterium]|nr:TonB-dependent receptor [Pseudomonadota bacterium]MDA1083635.1 TonB-dependent receptor [Pseudomonadota bacterium]